MAKFTVNKTIDILWNDLYLAGPAGTVFTIPDAYYDEFVTEVTHSSPDYTWISTNEGADLSARIDWLYANGLLGSTTQ
jgi:hypothetical protein